MAPISTEQTNGHSIIDSLKEQVHQASAPANGTSKVSTPKTYMGVDGVEHEMPEIKQEDIDHWYKHGYVIVKNFLHPDELKAVLKGFQEYMPEWDEFQARAPMFQNLQGNSDKSSPGWVRYEYPYENTVINKMQVHPFLVAFAERLHGHQDIQLSHGAIVGKYAGKADYDQALHADYTNNTLVMPLRGTENEGIDIPMIVYYTDVTEDLGPTYVVSNVHGTQDVLHLARRWYTREEFPQFYKVEKPAVCPAGSVMIYNMRTFHRGSSMLAKVGRRFTQFVAFHTAGKSWLASHTFTGLGDKPGMKKYIAEATPRERELIGFPKASDPYWKCDEARINVHNRYPTMDMSPYGGVPDSFEP